MNNNATPDNNFSSGNPFPSGIQTPLGAAGGLLTGVGNGLSLDFPGRRIPRSQQVSLGIQRQLPDNILLDVRYTGNFTNRLRTTAYSGAQGNIWINGTWTKTQQLAAQNSPNLYNGSVVNPFYGVPSVPASSQLGSSPTIAVVDLTVPYAQFPGPLGDYDDPLGKSWYNAMELQATKRLSHGVSFRAAYTYSKTMQATGYINGWPYQDSSLLYQISPTDRTHVFTLTGEYNLPSLRADDGAKKVVGAVVNHWELSNVFTWQTGFPVGLPGGFQYLSNHSYTPTGGPTDEEYLYNCNGAPLTCWVPFPNNYYLGYLPSRIGTLRQPSMPNLDVSIMRTFPIHENINLQLRGDGFNVTNTVLFSGPDTNPYDGPPVKQSNGTYSGFGTVGPTQQNFPRILQISLKLRF